MHSHERKCGIQKCGVGAHTHTVRLGSVRFSSPLLLLLRQRQRQQQQQQKLVETITFTQMHTRTSRVHVVFIACYSFMHTYIALHQLAFAISLTHIMMPMFAIYTQPMIRTQRSTHTQFDSRNNFFGRVFASFHSAFCRRGFLHTHTVSE